MEEILSSQEVIQERDNPFFCLRNVCENEVLELMGGTFAVIFCPWREQLPTEDTAEKSKKNWALDDLVTPINYTSLNPTLRLLFMEEN